jgi:hypothetical protein
MADGETNAETESGVVADASAGAGSTSSNDGVTGSNGGSGNGGGDDSTKSIEDIPVDPTAAKPVEPIVRDPDPAREAVRSDLARGLLWLLTITIASVIFFVGLGQVPSEVLTQSIFPSLVTLTGTALGFYFGAQTASKG